MLLVVGIVGFRYEYMYVYERKGDGYKIGSVSLGEKGGGEKGGRRVGK